MQLVKVLVVVGVLYYLLEDTAIAAGLGSAIGAPVCGDGETLGTWNGVPTCLHQGGVGFAGGDGTDSSSPVSNDSLGTSLANAWDGVLALLGLGPITSPDQLDNSGPITSPDQT